MPVPEVPDTAWYSDTLVFSVIMTRMLSEIQQGDNTGKILYFFVCQAMQKILDYGRMVDHLDVLDLIGL